MSGIFSKVKDLIESEIIKQRTKPLTVCVLGQTGTGKSSLTNALFGTDFSVDDVMPCTKEIQRAELVDPASGGSLVFFDLPGIGESEKADSRYLDEYLRIAMESDLVLWTHHIDSRSVKFDVQALRVIVDRLEAEKDKRNFVSKLLVVLTKADLVSPDPWIFSASDGTGMFIPGEKTEHIFRKKTAYIREAYFRQFSQFLEIRCSPVEGEPYDPDWHPDLKKSEDHIYFTGFLDDVVAGEIISDYPESKPTIDKLLSNSGCLPCSTTFKYNLLELMRVILHKIGDGGEIFRLENFMVDTAKLSELKLSRALELHDLICHDRKSNTYQHLTI